MPLESLRNWRESFPCLASLHHAGAEDCEIVLLEASINMTAPASSFKGWELGTAFEVLASPTFAGHAWHYTTNIYDTGERIETHTAALPHVDMGFQDGTVKLQPSLLPRFWAPRFVVWEKERHHLEGRGDVQGAEERTRTRVRRTSAVQELYATASSNGAVPKRVAVVLWKFNKTKFGDLDGKTTWRNLIPPPSRILTNSPAPPPITAAPLQETLWPADSAHRPSQLSLYEENYDTQSFQPLGASPAETLPASPTPAYYPTDFSNPITQESVSSHAIGVGDSLEGLYSHPRTTSLLDAFDPAPVEPQKYLPRCKLPPRIRAHSTPTTPPTRSTSGTTTHPSWSTTRPTSRTTALARTSAPPDRRHGTAMPTAARP